MRRWVGPLRLLGDCLLGLFALVAVLGPWLPFEGALAERLPGLSRGLGIAAVVLVLTLLFLGGPLRRESETRWSAAGRAFAWFRLWAGMVTAIVATGAVLGVCLFVVVGALLGVELGLVGRVLAGARDGAFYALIWAPGVSFVVCCILAFGPRQGKPQASERAKVSAKE